MNNLAPTFVPQSPPKGQRLHWVLVSPSKISLCKCKPTLINLFLFHSYVKDSLLHKSESQQETEFHYDNSTEPTEWEKFLQRLNGSVKGAETFTGLKPEGGKGLERFTPTMWEREPWRRPPLLAGVTVKARCSSCQKLGSKVERKWGRNTWLLFPHPPICGSHWPNPPKTRQQGGPVDAIPTDQASKAQSKAEKHGLWIIHLVRDKRRITRCTRYPLF